MTLTFNCGMLFGVPRLLYIGRFSFSGRKCHLFDPETGLNLESKSN